MLTKTHIAIGIFAALILVEKVNFPIVFMAVTLIASVLPDIDSAFSSVGRKGIFRVVQLFTKHRGIFHSFTFCIIIAALLAFYWPVLAFPFFLGYGLHLLADSFTIEGIRPFWPFKLESKGRVRVGGPLEHVLFAGFCIADVALVFAFIL